MMRLIDQMEEDIRLELWNNYFQSVNPQLNPSSFTSEEDTVYIVTSRFDGKDVTRRWLKKNNISYDKLIFAKLDPKSMKDCGYVNWCKEQAKRKSKVINEENIDVHFEDNKNVVKELRKLCRDTKIINYSRRVQ